MFLLPGQPFCHEVPHSSLRKNISLTDVRCYTKAERDMRFLHYLGGVKSEQETGNNKSSRRRNKCSERGDNVSERKTQV